ncbi:hypothetical protein SAMN04487786_1522 [Paenisporosarcina quisquiliarum]|jgi:hypothetical protein|uniref:hypothetical protein n=1 Tax=Psychrobacillus TaxID=1221880 RepID=UPI0008D8A51F|nr:hypothetical protein [Psychrobacillus psychrodurans]MCK1996303.1 hypothetical protein [Psychrobacillus psychrodurans]MCZ8539395.1 hypothetical protein [Psychrobacillus psychrodurans]SEM25802.1 hypothetical protein SAMN04487786_1522 [Paenisporosarcina quisquiliarum]SFM37989.1 hypothetical protein SAMN05421832_102233 [Psychrobacillus psychrodurans]
MRQVVHIIRKEDMEKEKIQTLKMELDYELATLFDAMTNKNEKEISASKNRLAEIHQLLEELNALD